MVKGLGTDIIQIQRIERSLARYGDNLIKRILTPQERECLAQQDQPERYLAKRFAAKEAVAKALGTGFAQGLSWQHMAIQNDTQGAPQVRLSGRAAELMAKRQATEVLLSLSDERDYAVAFALLQ